MFSPAYREPPMARCWHHARHSTWPLTRCRLAAVFVIAAFTRTMFFPGLVQRACMPEPTCRTLLATHEGWPRWSARGSARWRGRRGRRGHKRGRQHSRTRSPPLSPLCLRLPLHPSLTLTSMLGETCCTTVSALVDRCGWGNMSVARYVVQYFACYSGRWLPLST